MSVYSRKTSFQFPQVNTAPKFYLGAAAALLIMVGCAPPAPPKAKKAEASKPNAAAESTSDIPSELMAQGQTVYDENCARCHTTGEGSKFIAPLIGSPKVLGAPEPLIKVILYGQRGESVVDGKLINGAMPPSDFLTDEEVAAVATYVRKVHGKLENPNVSPEQVGPQR